MAAPEPSASELSWSWVVEALASSDKVDVAVLYDLLQGTPDLYDILLKEAKERVALRCLEGMFDPAKGLKGIAASPSRLSNFGSSESLENILHRIRQETPLPNLRKDIQPGVESDFHFSIKQRKANLPKIALEQLKDVRENHDPLSESFEKLRGLAYRSLPKQTNLASGNGFEENHKNNDLGSLEQETERSCRNKDEDYVAEAGNGDMELDDNKPHQEEVSVGEEKGKVDDFIQLELETDIFCGNEDGYYAAEEGNNDSKKCTETDMELDHNEPHEEVVSVHGENHKNNDLIQLEREARESCGKEDGDYVADEGNVVSKEHTEADVELDHSKHHQEGVSVGGENHRKNDLIQSEQDVERPCANEDGDYAAEEGNDGSKKYAESDMELEWAEQKLCMKCNKDGDVLTCRSCPIVVHQKCLGFSANRTFCCPFCTYSNAVAECTKARRELSMFISGTPGFQLQAPSKRGAENVLPSPQIEDTNKSNGMYHGDMTSNDKHIDGPSGFPDIDVTQSKMKSTNLNTSSLDTPCKETHKKKMAVHHSENRSNQKQKQKQVENHIDKGFHDEEIAIGGKTQAEEELSHESRERRHIDQQNDASSSASLSEESSEDDNKKSAYTKYSLRHVKRENLLDHSATPPGRRNRNVWTAEEEEILKEGIKRFTSVHAQSIPWKSILEFGQSVFARNRTTVHLKDKWRNMLKADPGLKRLMGA